MNSVKIYNPRGVIPPIRKFLYGGCYPLIVAAWAFLCFASGLQALGLFALIAVGGFVLVISEDVTPVIPPFACCVLTLTDLSALTTAPYIVVYCLLAACLFYHFVRFPFKNFYFGKLFFPLFLVSAALFLGGLLSPQGLNDYGNGVLTAFSTGPLILIIYLFFVNGIKPPENFDLRKFISYVVVTATLFACLELCLCRVTQSDYAFDWERNVGWSNFNTIGAMTVACAPLCLYLAVKTGKSAAMLSVIVFMLATDILCHCDGCTGILFFSLPFMLAFTFFRLDKKDRTSFILCVFIIVVAACAAGVFALHKTGSENVSAYISDYIGQALKENGRSKLYEKAISLFKSNPILGIGLGFCDESVYEPTGSVVNFHSTFFHVIATMGCLGIVAYAVYIATRIIILLEGHSAFNAFAFLSFVLFETYGLIDVCEFNIIPLMEFMTLIVLCTELTNAKAEDARLPLNRIYP